MPPLTRITRRLAQPDIPFYALPWLMVLLVLGTVAQRDMGLYLAQKTFFSSWIFWVGPLPLPGGYATMALVGVALACKFLLASQWTWRDAGIVVAHGGALLLLIGGLLTAATAREGFMMIPTGQTADRAEDYLTKHLTVTAADGAVVADIPHARLRPGLQFTAGGAVFQILEYCHNCTPVEQTATMRGALPYRGPAAQVKMIHAPREKDEEANHSAVTLSIRNAAEDENGIHLMTDIMPHQPVIGDMTVRFGRVETALPFAIQLDRVKREVYPGTDMPRGYESHIHVIDGDVEWPALIRMNEPLRYRGYTFYQSNYAILPDGTEASILSVVRNTGWLFPYLASIVIALGMALHLGIVLKAARRAVAFVLLGLMFCAATPAHAAVDVRDTGFTHIPILHEGRIKPMDSFARAMHWRITGHEHPHGQSAAQWLAEILFDPLAAAERPQFTVRHPELAAILQLPARKSARYSFTELSAALAPHTETITQLLPRDRLTPAQEQLLALKSAVVDYTQLMRALSLLLPLAVPWADGDGVDYLDLRRYEEDAQNRLAAIMRAKGEDLDTYTDNERQIAAFAFQIAVMRDAADGNSLFRIIPPGWGDDDTWRAPWAMLAEGAGSPQNIALMQHWRDMANAWYAGERETFLGAAWAHYYDVISHADQARLKAEVFYNDTSPLAVAMALYALAALLALAAWRGFIPSVPGFAVALAGMAVHAAAMGLRVYVLERPPVGTLYESVLFVALIIAVTALVAARARPALLAAGMAAAAALLLAAPGLIAGGDTMPVLVAVLNTNFWLATHVIVITAGYGFALLCGLAAHGALLARAPSLAVAHRLALLALLFTTVGTILGGIWADQSWGRFWGWDPKENGALLIVLWLVWAMHGRRAGLLRPRSYAAALAAVNIIVALAWFGVNLLNVGLHSYGFTSGIATALTAYCTAQAALICILWYAGAQRERPA